MAFKQQSLLVSLVLLSLALLGTGALGMWWWLSHGTGALVLVCTLSGLLWLALLLRLFWRQQQLPIQMFRALANGDHTLGLPTHHLLRQSYESARARLQQASVDAAAQAQFLRHVLLHTELALLIYHQDGRVIEQSPAAARLLGQRVSHLNELAEPLRVCLLGAGSVDTHLGSGSVDTHSDSLDTHSNLSVDTHLDSVDTHQDSSDSGSVDTHLGSVVGSVVGSVDTHSNEQQPDSLDTHLDSSDSVVGSVDTHSNAHSNEQQQPSQHLARHSTVEWWHGDQPDTLAVLLSPVHIAGDAMCMATLQSIQQPLNKREQEAYDKLTRVLTHEIANSITPMASIAQSCEQLLPDGLCFADASDKADVQMALQTLSRRTDHLVEFIQNFRKVAAVPKPMLSYKPLSDVVHQVAQLWQNQCDQLGIQLVPHLLDHRVVAHDPAQLEQVLINLVKNAVEALQHESHRAPTRLDPAHATPQIVITLAPLNDAQTMIEVRDNGPGITPETATMMFVPFFTTKPQGSGIGLALARQMLRQHGGDLVYVPSQSGACFRVVLG